MDIIPASRADESGERSINNAFSSIPRQKSRKASIFCTKNQNDATNAAGADRIRPRTHAAMMACERIPEHRALTLG